nr:pyruvate, phosphate dikinase [Alphaproteobacteria bacterium]
MVFGNMGSNSATGVAFTRNPSTGAKELYGEFLLNAQGEDIVSGVRTPHILTKAGREEIGAKNPSLEEVMPDVFKELQSYLHALEKLFCDMQDVEFTIENGKVWLLQTRSGKRSAEASIRIAAEMADENILTQEEALMSVSAASLGQLLHAAIDPDGARDLIAKGLPASPGAASGEIVFDPQEAEMMKAQGRRAILVRVETSPEDVQGMHASAGVLTARGGMTSHAAVVARSMGVPCIVGAGAIKIEPEAGRIRIAGRSFFKGDTVTLDGSSGEVYAGNAPLRQPDLSGDFARLIEWADGVRRLGVRANADTPKDARQARSFGAEGIGLCRAEHMFFDTDRITIMREMILARDEAGRRAALDKILPMQRSDFTDLFEIMEGMPVTIRLLDPPLHEFLPHHKQALQAVADSLDISLEHIEARVNELSEFNPMLGFRGCRLAIRYPEITEMQARAIFEATLAAEKKTGHAVEPEVMIPFVATRKEFDLVADVIREAAREVEGASGQTLKFKIGAMVEVPRAALKSHDLVSGSEAAEFLSFGTNDLTQMGLGLSRDDASTILSEYTRVGIYDVDPFVSIDQAGVGELVRIGVRNARAVDPDIKMGICGEHGGDPASILFFDEVGLDYISCSPFRIPIARLAAAQSAIRLAAGNDSADAG